VKKTSPDIIAVTETLPKVNAKEIQKDEFKIEGYDLFTNVEKGAGRGVAIWTKTTLNALEVEFETGGAVESVWTRVKLRGGDKLLIGNVYRSPSSTPENDDRVNKLIVKASKLNFSHVLIMGDLNHPAVNWNNLSTEHAEGHKTFKFLESLKDSYLFQHVENPTHKRPGEKANILDLVLTNEENMVENLRHNEPLGKSHHHVITFEFACYSTHKDSSQRKLLLDKGNYEKIRQELEEEDWDEALAETNVNDAWSYFSSKLKSAAERHIPTKQVKSNAEQVNTTWVNEAVRTKSKLKREAFDKFLDTGSESDYEIYTKCSNETKWEVKKAKIEDERETANKVKENPKAFFNHANRKLKTKCSVAELETQNGTAETDEEKGEALGEFFSSVFTREDTENIPEIEEKNPQKILATIEITEQDVEKQINKLNPSKSAGPDNMHPRLLKETKSQIIKPMTTIFRKSMQEGKVPEDWKEGQITPIFKKGRKSDPGNYRPVSLTSVVCKMMESIIRDKVMEHMEGYICPEQHGFLPGRSCTTQLLDSLNLWTEWIHEKNAVDVIYLDFAKAFDSVPHRRLIAKLRSYGIQNNLLAWIESFLIGRRQRVNVNGTKSEWKEVISGVPQGSVLGPILFICYINDMPETVKSLIRIFADDTKVFSKINSDADHERLQEDLNALQTWSDKWQLRFNAKKCAVLHLGYYNQRRPYQMSSQGTQITLESTTCEKDLGVHIDPSLNFSKHCEKAANKANRMLGLIKRSFDYMDEDMLVKLFKGLVRPHLEYGNVVWSPLFKKDATILENVQRRATRLVPKLQGREYEDRLRALNLPSLVYRRHRGDMIEAYKYKNNIYKITEEILPKKERKYELRGHEEQLAKQNGYLCIRQNFFSLRISDNWNNLPRDVIEAPTLNVFKSRLDKHLSHLRFKTEFPLIKKHLRWEEKPTRTPAGR
jgi:hypothetical protein